MAATDDGVADGTPAPAEPEERASTTAAAIDDVKGLFPSPSAGPILHCDPQGRLRAPWTVLH